MGASGGAAGFKSTHLSSIFSAAENSWIRLWEEEAVSVLLPLPAGRTIEPAGFLGFWGVLSGAFRKINQGHSYASSDQTFEFAFRAIASGNRIDEFLSIMLAKGSVQVATGLDPGRKLESIAPYPLRHH